MSTTSSSPVQPQIEYPDSDGMPMSDNTLQFKWIVVIKEGTEALFRFNPNVFVAGDLLWYPVEGQVKIRIAPDTMVVFGRPKGYRGSYKQWVEDGIPPQVVFEVLSPGNTSSEMELKLAFYERYGVEEYYIYDPDDGGLWGYLRSGKALKSVPRMAGHVSPRLGVRFEPGRGSDNLTILGPDGEPFRTYTEVIDQRDAARRRADEAENRLSAAERRAEALAAKLRELGIDPE